MTQQFFDPITYGFKWSGNWYEFDSVTAHKAALRARNSTMRELRKVGHEVKAILLGNQLRTMGGIGSGHPEISEVVSGYGLLIV